MHRVNFVFRPCGFSVYRRHISLRKNPQFINSRFVDEISRVYKSTEFPGSFRQPKSFLYTSFIQYYAIFTSVICMFVHNFHRVYKYIYKFINEYINLTNIWLARQNDHNTKGLI